MGNDGGGDMWLLKLSRENDAASGTTFMVWWLRFHISMQGGSGLIPGQGTRSLMLQLKILHPARKIPHTARKILHAATKTQIKVLVVSACLNMQNKPN